MCVHRNETDYIKHVHVNVHSMELRRLDGIMDTNVVFRPIRSSHSMYCFGSQFESLTGHFVQFP